MRRVVAVTLALSTTFLASCGTKDSAVSGSSFNSSSSFTPVKPGGDGSLVLGNFLKLKHGDVKAWAKDNIFIERFFSTAFFKNYGIVNAAPQTYFRMRSEEDLEAPYIYYRCQKVAGEIDNVWRIDRGGDYRRYINSDKPNDKSWLYAVLKVDGKYIGMQTMDHPGKHKFIGYNPDPEILLWKKRFGGKAPLGLDNSWAMNNQGRKKISDIISKASNLEFTAGDGNEMFYAKFEFDPPLAERDISGMCEFATGDKLIPSF